jgi:hypothetical protein
MELLPVHSKILLGMIIIISLIAIVTQGNAYADSIITTIGVGGSPSAMVYNPSNEYLYAAVDE